MARTEIPMAISKGITINAEIDDHVMTIGKIETWNVVEPRGIRILVKRKFMFIAKETK